MPLTVLNEHLVMQFAANVKIMETKNTSYSHVMHVGIISKWDKYQHLLSDINYVNQKTNKALI